MDNAQWRTTVHESGPEPEVTGSAELDVSATDGFEAFYRSAYGSVASALAYTLGDVDFGAEAADEAMARAFARWATVRTLANPVGWVYRVGLNWARSVLRRLHRRPQEQRLAVAVEPATVADVELRQALLALDVSLRSVVVCRYLFDWSVEQTAGALGLRAGTVKSRLHRAMALLEARLAEPGDDQKGARP